LPPAITSAIRMGTTLRGVKAPVTASTRLAGVWVARARSSRRSSRSCCSTWLRVGAPGLAADVAWDATWDAAVRGARARAWFAAAERGSG